MGIWLPRVSWRIWIEALHGDGDAVGVARQQRNSQPRRLSSLTRHEQRENNTLMSAKPDAAAPQTADLDEAADQAIAACGGDAREAVKALLVANDFLEAQLERIRAKVSTGYARGRLSPASDRKE